MVVPGTDPRKTQETDDVLRDGKILLSHKSSCAAAGERRLGAADGVYFHAGRTHPAYGKVALVFRPLAEEDRAEVTPFGLGALLCRGNGDIHDQRRCVVPVAHLPDPEQAAFVAASTWRSDWRDHAPHFVAAYFGSELDAYFALDGEVWIPLRARQAKQGHVLVLRSASFRNVCGMVPINDDLRWVEHPRGLTVAYVARARSEGHPDAAWLGLLADVIGEKATPAVLDAWPAWTAA